MDERLQSVGRLRATDIPRIRKSPVPRLTRLARQVVDDREGIDPDFDALEDAVTLLSAALRGPGPGPAPGAE